MKMENDLKIKDVNNEDSEACRKYIIARDPKAANTIRKRSEKASRRT